MRSFNLLMPPLFLFLDCNDAQPLNMINASEGTFTAFCCTFSVTLPNFEMILNVDEQICCRYKGGEKSFTYSVFLAPALLPEEWH